MKLYVMAVVVAAATALANGTTLENAAAPAAAAEPAAAAPAAAAAPKDITAFLPHLEKLSKLRTKIAALELSVAQVAPATPPAPVAAATGKEGKKGKKGKKGKEEEEKVVVVDKAKVAQKLEKKKAELTAVEALLKTAGVDVEAEVAKLGADVATKLRVKETKTAMREAAVLVEEELRQAWAAKLTAEKRPAFVEPLLPVGAGPIEYTQAKIAKLEAKLEEQKWRLAYLQEKEKRATDAAAAAAAAPVTAA